ncbi:MAG: carbamate kinase [Opitutales bacterium]
MSPPLVIALGGNALSPADADPSIEAQFRRAMETAREIARVFEHTRNVLLTHGNGPQIGSIVRRVELAMGEIHTLPLDVCIADSQAGIGYMLSQCLRNEGHATGRPMDFLPVLTTVEVDAEDPAFTNPTKPFGRYYRAEEAEALVAEYGGKAVEVKPGLWRRVAPSPEPRRILELERIQTLVTSGVNVIAGGGGGIPVLREADGTHRGVEAIIDKDATSALLAVGLGCERLIIATEAKGVAVDFGKPTQRYLKRLTVAEAQQLQAAGTFPAGSMGPKVAAAILFLQGTSAPAPTACICALDELAEAVAGRAGTEFVCG